MKKITFLLVFIFIIVGFTTGCTSEEVSDKALAIRDIQSDPLSFTGEITITGVAAAFSDVDETVFGVVDTAELLACKNLNCGAFVLPAKYVGYQPLPKLADEVNITGSWAKAESGYVFNVTKIDIKRNIMNLITN